MLYYQWLTKKLDVVGMSLVENSIYVFSMIYNGSRKIYKFRWEIYLI
jgi:hypothetical protein